MNTLKPILIAGGLLLAAQRFQRKTPALQPIVVGRSGFRPEPYKLEGAELQGAFAAFFTAS